MRKDGTTKTGRGLQQWGSDAQPDDKGSAGTGSMGTAQRQARIQDKTDDADE